MTILLSTLILILPIVNGNAQDTIDDGGKHPISLTIGYLFKNAVLSGTNDAWRHSVNGIYAYEHLSGFGLNAGVQYELNRFLFDLNSTIRYDYMGYEKTGYKDEAKEILVDINFSILGQFKLKKESKKVFYAGIGYSVNNAWKKKTTEYTDRFSGEKKSQTYGLNYPTVNLILGIPIWRLYLEPKLAFALDNDFILFSRHSDDIPLLWSVRVYYRFGL